MSLVFAIPVGECALAQSKSKTRRRTIQSSICKAVSTQHYSKGLGQRARAAKQAVGGKEFNSVYAIEKKEKKIAPALLEKDRC